MGGSSIYIGSGFGTLAFTLCGLNSDFPLLLYNMIFVSIQYL